MKVSIVDHLVRRAKCELVSNFMNANRLSSAVITTISATRLELHLLPSHRI